MTEGLGREVLETQRAFGAYTNDYSTHLLFQLLPHLLMMPLLGRALMVDLFSNSSSTGNVVEFPNRAQQAVWIHLSCLFCN